MPFNSDPNLDEDNQNQSGGTPTSQAPVGQTSGQPNAVSGSTPNQTTAQSQNSATQAPAAPSLATGGSITSAGTGQGMSSGGNSSSAAGAAAPYSPSTPSSGGSNWTNLQSYLNANNTGAFGQQFANQVDNTVNQASQGITNAASNFQNEVNSGTVNDNSGLDQSVENNPAGLSGAQQTAFENELNGSYAGPTNTSTDSGFQNATTAANAAQSEAQAAETPGGQAALLNQFYNAPNYTPGQQALDSALLSADPSSQSALEGVQQNASQLGAQLNSAEAAGTAEAGTGAADTAAAQQAALETLYGENAAGQPGSAANLEGGALGNLVNTLGSQATTATNTFNTEQSDIDNAFKSGNFNSLTPAEQSIVQGLGIANPLGAAPTYGINSNTYLKNDSGVGINESTDATAQQVAQLNALTNLAGIPDNYIDTAQAGTAPTGPVSFNEGGYANAINSAEGQYNTAVAPINQQIQQAIANTSGSVPAGMNPGTNAQTIAGLYNQLNAINEQYGLPPVNAPSQGTILGGPPKTITLPGAGNHGPGEPEEPIEEG